MDEAAFRIASAASGEGITLTEPHEGKIELRAEHAGLLKIDRERLYELVSQDEIMFASIQENIKGIRVVKSFVREDYEQKKKQILGL